MPLERYQQDYMNRLIRHGVPDVYAFMAAKRARPYAAKIRFPHSLIGGAET